MLRDIKINDMNLSVRAFNCLRHAGLSTIGDIVTKEENDGLIKIRNLGRKCVDEILAELKRYNIVPGIQKNEKICESGMLDAGIPDIGDAIGIEDKPDFSEATEPAPQLPQVLSCFKIEECVSELVYMEMAQIRELAAETEFLRKYFSKEHTTVAFSYLIDTETPAFALPVAGFLAKAYSSACGASFRKLETRSVTQLVPEQEDSNHYTKIGINIDSVLRYSPDDIFCLTDIDLLAILSQDNFSGLLEFYRGNRDKCCVLTGDISFESPLMRDRLGQISTVMPLRKVDLNNVKIDEFAILKQAMNALAGIPSDSISEEQWHSFRQEHHSQSVEDCITGFIIKTLFWLSTGGIDLKESIRKANHPPEKALDILENMAGLHNVKETVRDVAAHCEIARLKSDFGSARDVFVPNALFMGNPGTGKTTVAGLISQMYQEMGLLRKGHLVTANRSSLVACYMGQTAVKTRDVFMSALDGVLFVDEAYALCDAAKDSFGKEALATLTQLISDFAGRCCVIFAGYEKDMNYMLDNGNPGLRERFPFRLYFNDYSVEELMEIFLKKVSDKRLMISATGKKIISGLIARLYTVRDESFANGRLADNILQELILQQERRLFETLRAGDTPSQSDFFSVTTEDCRKTECVILKRQNTKPETNSIGFRLSA